MGTTVEVLRKPVADNECRNGPLRCCCHRRRLMLSKDGTKIQEWQCWFGKQYYEMSEEVDELREKSDYLEKREQQLSAGTPIFSPTS